MFLGLQCLQSSVWQTHTGLWINLLIRSVFKRLVHKNTFYSFQIGNLHFKSIEFTIPLKDIQGCPLKTRMFHWFNISFQDHWPSTIDLLEKLLLLELFHGVLVVLLQISMGCMQESHRFCLGLKRTVTFTHKHVTIFEKYIGVYFLNCYNRQELFNGTR